MKNTYKALGPLLPLAAAAYFSFTPVDADAFYVSDKEAQKAGISRKDITKDKQPLPDTVSYKGHLEGDETFPEIARRINNWAQDFFGTELSEEVTFEALSEFNSYRKVEMPLVSTPCKYQFMMNYVKQLEKRRGKAGYKEDDLELLKGQLHKLEELYEHDITDLKARYNDHEMRIKQLEERPEQQDYSGEIEELKKENRELREMIGGMEGGYGQPRAEAPAAYPPAGGGTTVIYGHPGWFTGLPYYYEIRNGYICTPYWIGGSIFWRPWGWLDFYSGYYYARGFDGGTYHYHGPTSYLPKLKDHWDRHRPDGRKGRKDIPPKPPHSPDTGHWKGKEIPRKGMDHRSGGRGTERFGDRGRRDTPRGELPRQPRTYGPPQGRQDSRRPLQGGFQRGPQFNQRQARPGVPQHNFQRAPPVMQQRMPQGGGSRGGSFSGQQRSFGNQGGQHGGATFRGGASVTPQAQGGIRGRRGR